MPNQMGVVLADIFSSIVYVRKVRLNRTPALRQRASLRSRLGIIMLAPGGRRAMHHSVGLKAFAVASSELSLRILRYRQADASGSSS
jgi:hypothetical protein